MDQEAISFRVELQHVVNGMVQKFCQKRFAEVFFEESIKILLAILKTLNC